MIENFIEKDIIRQVKLTEYLYELKTLTVKDVAKRLKVTFNTVKRDFSKINVILQDYIEYSETTSTTIHLYFFSNFTRYDLIKEIYKESRFLRVCSRYLMGDMNYLNIVEEEFVSIAKAFKIKNDVEAYFRSSNIMDEEGHLIENEIEYRFVILGIWMRCDLLDQQIDKEKYKLAGIFVDQILNRLINGYEMNKREYRLLIIATYLSITRSKISNLNYTKEELYYLKDSINFKQIDDIAKIVLGENKLSENEIAYLVAIYKSIHFNTTNYLIVMMNYMQKREQFIELRPKTVKQLVKKIEDEFNSNLNNDILFEKPFINFLNTLWYNMQSYTLERHYYLSDSQLDIFYKMKVILEEWKSEIDADYNIEINDTSLEKFCSEIETSLTKKWKNKFVIIIVAEDELSHVIYRENITRWLNMDYNVIDNTMYYSMEDVPVYVEEWPHIIICERSVLSKNYDNQLNIFFISKSTLFNDIKNILLYIYNWK